tara:strand:- start:3332 stop:3442 length:111 start_codon:yes stop_codon:yes gene_type:complete
MLLEEPSLNNHLSEKLKPFKKSANQDYFHIYDHPQR